MKQVAIAMLACCFSPMLLAAPADCEATLRTWREWAQQGDAGAQHFIATLFLKGEGVARDEDEAVRWLREAADQGLASAQYDLSVAYITGRGVAKDDSEVARWTRKAAEQGFAPAQHNLGSQYVNGSRGVAKDAAEGVRWFRKAADQGWVPSQRSLVAVYWQGKDAPKDVVEAYKWATLAMEGTEAGPERVQTSRGRDEIGKSMTPDQVAQASQLAHTWKPTGTAIYPDPRFARLGEPFKVTSGQIIETRTYTLSAPMGEAWDAQVDSYNDAVAFTRGVPATREFARISIARSDVDLVGTARDEAGVVTAFQCVSEINFREQGKSKSHALREVNKQVEMIDGKTLYVVRYVVTDQSLSIPVESEEAVYIYLPPKWKESKRIYLFSIAQLQKVGDVATPTDPSQVNSVISSLREK